KITPDAKAGHVVIRLHVPDHEHVLVHCVAFSLPLPMPEPVMLTLRKARFQSSYTDYAVLREQVEAIEGHNWHTLAFARAMLPPEVKVHSAGGKMKTTEYLLHRDKVGYLINLIAAESDHDAYQEAVRNIVASVSFAGDPAQPANAGPVVEVRTPDELRRAVTQLQPGTTLKIGPGDYPGGHSVSGLAGLTIAALDPEQPPHFRGGGNAWHFSRCPGLTLSNLRISGQTGNGLNLDDGGELGRPVTGVTIERVEVRDIGPKGNHDGIKCSGLDELTIRDCVLEGWGGQGIDMVGCHDVRISGCKFRGKAGFTATAAVQTKGGSSDVTVEKCHFFQAGERPLNVGGSTGLAYFRPQGVPHEAARITVRDNVIEGSPCAVAFVGVDSAEFTGNLILYPEKWIFRILQETRQEPFVPCRNVRVADNRIVFRRCQVAIEVNVGDGTAPETFRFERNRWFAEDRPDSSRPRLPVAEQDGQYGADPR
ncbi:MAG: right-handed parallel beta-helix repeat-containing protein, partial [Pirellulaceae bacterium]